MAEVAKQVVEIDLVLARVKASDRVGTRLQSSALVSMR
jgi:hypothetical protein